MKRFIETYGRTGLLFFSVSPPLKDRRDNSALAVKLVLFIHVNIKLFGWLQGEGESNIKVSKVTGEFP